MDYETLCIFTTTGRTYTFRQVVIESDNETAITFAYRAMSDDLRKRGTFYKANMAGFATFPMEPKQ